MSRSIPSIFADALACETPDEVAALLDQACGENAAMRRDVERLLAAHKEASGFLEPQTVLVDPSITIGTVIGGRYKLLEAIGEGGMGTVWVAEQTEPVRRKVAIKLVKAGMDSKQVLVRFKAERQALALMDHPNIAKVLDGGVTDNGRPFFAMEYVKGVPITRYCDDAHLPLRERLRLFVSVCQAVQHAHQKGIIHRDLKPSNILVCQYDGLPVVKVIDFGLAKAINQPLTTQTLHTAHGIMIGTPLYMSPEQAEFNNLDVDTRTDVYSLGVVLYELLTGSTPLEKQQIQRAALDELLRLIKEVEPARPSTRLSTSEKLPSVAAQRGIDPKQLGRLLKGDLDWIVMKSLEKDRSRRYETANGMARDIERFLTDEPVEACPPSARYRLGKLMKRYRRPLVGATAVAAALVLGIVATTAAMFEARRQAELARVAAIDESQARQQAERAEVKANQQLEVARAEKARADEEAARAVASTNFLRNLLGPPGSSDLESSQELKDRRIADVIAAAGAALDGLEEQPQLELDGRLMLASTYEAITEMNLAKEQYQRAAELSRELNGPDSDATLQIEIDYLFVSHATASRDDTEHARRLVAKLTERHGADDPMTCEAKNCLALILKQQDQIEESISIHTAIIESIRRNPETFHPKGRARYFFNLANLVGSQGREAEADQLVIEACANCDREPHTDPFRCVRYYSLLGQVHLGHGRTEQTFEAWQTAFDRSASLGMTSERAELIKAMIPLCGELKRYDYARELLECELKALDRGRGVDEQDYIFTVMSQVQLAEATMRLGKVAEGEKLLEKIEQSLRERIDEFPENLSWWLHFRRLAEMCRRGTYVAQSWRSPALGTAAEATIQYTLERYTVSADSPSYDWEGLTIDLFRWEGPDAEVSKPIFHGSLAELSRFDPPAGLYLLAIDLPRKGIMSAKGAIWFLESDWDLSFYDADELTLDETNAWDVLKQATPFEQRHGPVASWHRISKLDSFAKFSPHTNVLAAARTHVSLPAGTYSLGLLHDGVAVAWVDQKEHDAESHIEFDDQPKEVKYVWLHGTESCYPVIEPSGPAADRLVKLVNPPIFAINHELELAQAAVINNPLDVPATLAYARLSCRVGRFDEALSFLAVIEDELLSDHNNVYHYAALAAYMRDHERYRKLCAELMTRYPEEGNSIETGEQTAKCCLILPQQITKMDPRDLAGRIDRAVAEPVGKNAPWFYLAKSLHLYRLGDDHAAESVEWSDRAISSFSDPRAPSMCYFVRAMALERSGKHAEALKAFQDAERYHVEHAGVAGHDDLGNAYADWMFDEIIAREARELFADTETAASP